SRRRALRRLLAQVVRELSYPPRVERANPHAADPRQDVRLEVAAILDRRRRAHAGKHAQPLLGVLVDGRAAPRRAGRRVQRHLRAKPLRLVERPARLLALAPTQVAVADDVRGAGFEDAGIPRLLEPFRHWSSETRRSTSARRTTARPPSTVRGRRP